MGRPLACTRVCDKKAWFGQHDVTLPILLLVSRCGLDSYTASVVSSKRKESSVYFCDAYSTQNWANKQHGVKCYFRLIWCETHAAPAVVRSIHIKHGEEYIYSHSALPRAGPNLNAALTWDTCLPQDFQWFIPTVQRNLVHVVFLTGMLFTRGLIPLILSLNYFK